MFSALMPEPTPPCDPGDALPEDERDAILAKLRPWQRRFVLSLRERPVITDACRAANISRSSAYAWRDKEPDFAAAWDDACIEGWDEVESAAYKEAVIGREKLTYDKEGNIKSRESVRDPRMIELLLRGNRPEKYREKVPVVPSAMPMLDAALAKCLATGSLAAFARKLAARQPAVIEAEAIPSALLTH
ncbi:MAG: hypothetical protein K8R87_13885 [Verrucomicrobia bacterium]|nr:hypothetical protein [Verrucomicrobiota bacterium]